MIFIVQDILVIAQGKANAGVLAQAAVIGIKGLMMMFDIQGNFVGNPQYFAFEGRLFFMDEDQVNVGIFSSRRRHTR